MNIALLEGDIASHPEREKAPRQQPGGLVNFSSPNFGYSAFNRLNQVENTVRAPFSSNLIQPEWRIFAARSPRARLIASRRLKQIGSLLRSRCGGACITDDAILFLEEALLQIAITCGPTTLEFNLTEWAALHTPALSRAQIDDAIVRILPNPQRYTSMAIGQRLNVTEEEWQLLNLWHIRPAGWTRAVFKEKVKNRKAHNRKTDRLATGQTKTPRDLSASRIKPWLAAGYNTRRTWERHGKPTSGATF